VVESTTHAFKPVPFLARRPTMEVKVAYLIGLVCFFGMSPIVVVGASVFSRNMA
jgi:hypothetical protein